MIPGYFIAALGLSLLTGSASAMESPSALRYCVPVSKFDFNPLRKLEDGKELAYLSLALRSYISTVPGQAGLLEAYSFTPDGTVFTAKVNPEAKWIDGSQLTPQEAANGISAAIPYRPIGEKVSVTGVKIVSESTFQLTLRSDSKNVTGLIRDALTSGSMHNRMWPVKGGSSGLQVIGKWPLDLSTASPTMQIDGSLVQMVGGKKCVDFDFTLYPEFNSPKIAAFTVSNAPVERAVVAQLNTQSLSESERKEFSRWLRRAFNGLPAVYGVVPTAGFFKKGEAGFSPEIQWGTAKLSSTLSKRTFRIATGIPVYEEILRLQAEKDEVRLEFTEFPPKSTQFDAHLMGSIVQQGRLIFLQDILSWDQGEELMRKAPRTLEVIRAIRAKSATTLPPDDPVLQRFEQTAISEAAVVPIARRHTTALTRKGLPLQLVIDASGEVNFKAGVK